MATALLDPRQIRPSRGWYVLAFLVPVLGVIVGVVALALSFTSAAKTAPELFLKSDSGASSSTRLVGGRSYQIYVPQAAVASASCTLDNTTTATVTRALDDAAARDLESFNSDGVTWQAHDVVDVTTTDVYKISCGGTKFAVADQDKTDTARVKKLAGGAYGFAGLPCAAITFGVVIGVVVAARRSSSRKRLQQANLRQGQRWTSDAYQRPY